jgi:hypothetical protein
MSNKVQFTNAELASIKVATASNGNPFISGVIVDRSEEGKFIASKSFRSFTLVEAIAALPAVQAFAELSAEEQKAAKAARPRVTVSGWLKSSQNAKGVWSDSLVADSITLA